MTSAQKFIKTIATIFAIAIILLIIYVIMLLVDIYISGNSKYNRTTNTYTDITNIEIDINSANIIIKRGKQFQVEVIDINDDIKFIDEKSTLKIEENDSFLKTVSGTIIIYVPKGELQQLDIESGASTVLIEDMTIQNIEIEQGAGSIEINNCYFNYIDIDGGAGDININNSTLNNTDIESGVGKINIKAYMNGNNQLDCGVGAIDLLLLGNESDYRIITNKGINSLKINEEKYTEKEYGSGPNKIKLDGGIGSININFEDQTQ